MMRYVLVVASLLLFVPPTIAEPRLFCERPDGGASIVTPVGPLQEVLAEIPAAWVCTEGDSADLPSDRTFRNAWTTSGGVVSVDIVAARDIHAERMGAAHANEIARLKVEERKERLKGNTAQADAHAATVTALEALSLNVLATQIGNAPNPTALQAIWPANVPR